MHSILSIITSLVLSSSIGPSVENTSTYEVPPTNLPELTVEVASFGTVSVPRGAVRVPMLQLNLTASCVGDVPLESITVHHQGLGALSDIQSISILDGHNRISRSRTFNSSNPVLTLRLERGVHIQACSTRTLTITANYSSDAEGEHRLILKNESDIIAEASVRILESPSITHVPLTRLTGTEQGNVNVEQLDLIAPIEYGKNQILARLRIESSSDTNQRIEAITFTNKGSATDYDVRRLYMDTNAGTPLTTIAHKLDGDEVRLEFSPPLILQRSDRRVIRLRGDIRASRKRTVRFVIEESTDVEAYSR